MLSGDPACHLRKRSFPPASSAQITRLNDLVEPMLSLRLNQLHHLGQGMACIKVLDGLPPWGGAGAGGHPSLNGKESVRHGASVALPLISGQCNSLFKSGTAKRIALCDILLRSEAVLIECRQKECCSG
jgi:hypothetical protein